MAHSFNPEPTATASITARRRRWLRVKRAKDSDVRTQERGTAVLLPLLLLFTPLTMAQENVRLACEPRTVAVVPGEPVRVEFTVQSASAAPVRVHIPADPLLVLRAVEKLPVRRTTEGVIIHKRVVIWQALEPGAVALRAISVETQGRKRLFPEITITVSDPGP
jgi:hypothetical protein